MIRFRITLIVAAAAMAVATSVCLLSAPSTAQTSPPAASSTPAVTRYGGKVTAVDPKALTITIHNRKTGDMTFTATSATKVKVNKEASQFGAITVGQFAMIRSSDGKTAIAIMAHDAKKPGAAPNSSASPGTAP